MFNLFKGWLGEKTTQLGLQTRLDSEDYKRFHDVIFPAYNGTTQVDHILLSKFGIFVIETKNINGWVFGNERSKQWTQSLYGKKYKFQNPLHQKYRHTKAVAKYLDVPHENVHSVIFFIGDNVELKTELPSNVMTHGLSSYIKQFDREVFTEYRVAGFVSDINKLLDINISAREHVASLKERFASTTTCPRCGEELVQRTAKRGTNAGRQFLGCSDYPKCKYSKNI